MSFDMNAFSLEGKVALITGASHGIGMAIAAKYMAAGAKVIITGTNEEKLRRCCQTLGGGENIRSLRLIVTDISEFDTLVERALALYPEAKIDILVNCVGVNAIGPGQTATRMLGMEENDSIYNATNPVGRYAMPEEIANLALLMVGKTGDLIIGETFYITGGSGSISMHR